MNSSVLNGLACEINQKFEEIASKENELDTIETI
jgi:hypothetical protein